MEQFVLIPQHLYKQKLKIEVKKNGHFLAETIFCPNTFEP